MREMKDSGVEWIGKIPRNWEQHPLYCYFDERKNRNFDLKERNLFSLSYGNIIKKDINTTGGLLPASFNTYNIVKKLDIIIRPTDLQNDKRSLRTGLVKDEKGIITSAYIALKPRHGVFSNYFHYLLHSYDVMKVFYNMGNGVRQGLNYSEFSKLMIIAPPSLQEQTRIADFLDQKCSEIDALTADIQTQIETLEEYKKSVITEAVTKGLDPNVEMKDSGVEWIGKIPEKWAVPKILYCLKMPITDGPHTTPALYDEGIPFVSAEAVSFGRGSIDFTHIRGYISNEFYRECCKKYIPSIGDIFMIKSGATTGKVSIVDTDKIFTIWSPLAVFRTNSSILKEKYLFYVLQSDYIQKQIQTRWSYGTQENIGMRVLEKLKITLPQINTQTEIADFLDKKCSEIDQTISEKQQQLEILAEYKKSLIYEYVTGKKEVS